MGDQFDESKMMRFPAGSFAYVDPTMHHYAAASGETIIQIHGHSPLAINYINPMEVRATRSKQQAQRLPITRSMKVASAHKSLISRVQIRHFHGSCPFLQLSKRGPKPVGLFSELPTNLRECGQARIPAVRRCGRPDGCSTVHPDNSLHFQLQQDSLGSTR
jgi:hypothetical protein